MTEQEVFEKAKAYPFTQFVADQPADREIEHYGGWVGCAVGDYLTEGLGMSSIEAFNFIEVDSFPIKEAVVGLIGEENESRLCNGNHAAEFYPNYGALNEAQQENKS